MDKDSIFNLISLDIADEINDHQRGELKEILSSSPDYLEVYNILKNNWQLRENLNLKDVFMRFTEKFEKAINKKT